MDDLVTWLRAQIDEDERLAVDAAGAPWSADVPGMVHVAAVAIAQNRALRGLGYVASVEQATHRDHIARHDPARVLREVAAKRALLDFCENAPAASYPDFDGGYASALEEVIPYLAVVYSDRDGYRPEWAPDPSG